MAAGTAPIFVTTPKRPAVRISVANTARDGTGTLGTVATAGANGDFYKSVHIQPEVAIPFGDVIRLFNQVGGSGNNELIAEIAVPISNPAASAAGSPPIPALPSIDWIPPNGLVLGAADVLKASTDQGKTYSVACEGGGSY
jgi:hypothetical protein